MQASMGRLWKFRKEEVDQWVKSGGADDNRPGAAGRLKNDDNNS